MKKWKVLGITLLCGIILVGCSGNDDTASSSSTKEASESSIANSSESEVVEESSTVEESVEAEDTGDFVENASDASFDGTILKGNSYSIKITNYKVIPVGESGNEYGESPVIAFWYDTMVAPNYDNSAPIDPTTAWMMNFSLVQDNDSNMVNELNIASHPDDTLLDSQMAEIKPGGTVSNAVAYELTDTETPVTLTAGSLFGDSYGSADFEVK